MASEPKPCPYHSTLANGMRLYPASHPCLTVYAEQVAEAGERE